MLKIELSEKAKETLRAVQTLPEDMLVAIADVMGKQNGLTVAHIQQKYLSFPSSGPSVPIGLRFISGRYRNSLRASRPVIQGQAVQSAIGTNIQNNGVSYPAVHEFGATIPAHDVVAKNTKALRFRIGDRVLFRNRVHVPEVQLPARAPIQHGIEDRADEYSDAISDAIEKLWNQGAGA